MYQMPLWLILLEQSHLILVHIHSLKMNLKTLHQTVQADLPLARRIVSDISMMNPRQIAFVLSSHSHL